MKQEKNGESWQERIQEQGSVHRLLRSQVEETEKHLLENVSNVLYGDKDQGSAREDDTSCRELPILKKTY